MAIFTHDYAAAYPLSASLYEKLFDALDGLAFADLVKQSQGAKAS